MPRRSELTRSTAETKVTAEIDIDGRGVADVVTGLGFLDHMVSALVRHSSFDLTLRASGDTHVDDHHTVEDCAIVLGRVLDSALGDRVGIARFGSAYAPLDESLSRAAVDLSGRPWAEVHLPFARETIGDVASENLVHFLRSLAIEGRMALHVDLVRGDNDHHKAEASFKAVAVAFRAAVGVVGETVPSTKRVLG